MNETRRKPTTGRQSPTLFDKWHGFFYMPSRIDEAVHTKAFDDPVAEHWGESQRAKELKRKTGYTCCWIYMAGYTCSNWPHQWNTEQGRRPVVKDTGQLQLDDASPIICHDRPHVWTSHHRSVCISSKHPVATVQQQVLGALLRRSRRIISTKLGQRDELRESTLQASLQNTGRNPGANGIQGQSSTGSSSCLQGQGTHVSGASASGNMSSHIRQIFAPYRNSHFRPQAGRRPKPAKRPDQGGPQEKQFKRCVSHMQCRKLYIVSGSKGAISEQRCQLPLALELEL